MDDTESYLNSILKKRLGSVPNYNSSAKTAQTVTRIPKQQQKIESMPTVFRKKHQTLYVPNQQSQYSQIHSEYISMKQGSQFPQSFIASNQIPEENRQSSNQRVEYMLISKRIQSKKQDDFISPTVDVTSYKPQKLQTIQQNIQVPNQREFQSNIYKNEQPKMHHVKSAEYLTQKPKNTGQDHNYDNPMASKISMQTDKSKRKKIF